MVTSKNQKVTPTNGNPPSSLVSSLLVWYQTRVCVVRRPFDFRDAFVFPGRLISLPARLPNSMFTHSRQKCLKHWCASVFNFLGSTPSHAYTLTLPKINVKVSYKLINHFLCRHSPRQHSVSHTHLWAGYQIRGVTPSGLPPRHT